MQLQLPLTEKNDIKIFILYLMQSIGYPLDFNNISDIMIQDGIVGYFDFAECFAELIDAGHIVKKNTDGKEFYFVSDKGTTVAEELKSSLAPIIRESSLRSALRHLSFVRRGASFECNVSKTEFGKFNIRCRIIEKEETIFDTSIIVDTKKQADEIAYNFRQRPEVIFRGTLALLSGDVNYIFEP